MKKDLVVSHGWGFDRTWPLVRRARSCRDCWRRIETDAQRSLQPREGQYLLGSRCRRRTASASPWQEQRSEEQQSELQSLMRISSAVLCATTKNHKNTSPHSY